MELNSYRVNKKMYEILERGGYCDQDPSPIKTKCQYLVFSDGKFCRLTTQKSCANCRFYSPDAQARNEMLVDAVLRAEDSRADALAAAERAEIDKRKAIKKITQKNESDQMYLEYALQEQDLIIKRFNDKTRDLARIAKSILRHRRKTNELRRS